MPGVVDSPKAAPEFCTRQKHLFLSHSSILVGAVTTVVVVAATIIMIYPSVLFWPAAAAAAAAAAGAASVVGWLVRDQTELDWIGLSMHGWLPGLFASSVDRSVASVAR